MMLVSLASGDALTEYSKYAREASGVDSSHRPLS